MYRNFLAKPPMHPYIHDLELFIIKIMSFTWRDISNPATNSAIKIIAHTMH